jgi:carbon storage regulator CsrA
MERTDRLTIASEEWIRAEFLRLERLGDDPCAESSMHLVKERLMLVLTRKVGERIHIGDSIVVTVVRIQHDKVRIGIEAPPDVGVHREEVFLRIAAESTAAEGLGRTDG